MYVAFPWNIDEIIFKSEKDGESSIAKPQL